MSDLDQKKLEAEITNLQAQTAKIDAERHSLGKSWRDWAVIARTLHVSQHKRIAPITVRLIPRLLSGELKKKAGQTATNTTPRVTAIVCANCAKSEAAKTSGNPESCGAFVTMMKATHSVSSAVSH